MIQKLHQLDTDLFLWLNGRYTPWLDPIMVWVTERNSWFPFYALLVGWLIYRYRKQAIGLLLTIIAAVALSDQVSSSVLKPLTLRPRPCHVEALQKLIHPVLDCGGQYGFVSSHAATTFALATTLWLLLGRQHPWIRLTFLWAAFVSYSRIYVAAHYPLDVLAGTGVGVLSAVICVTLYNEFRKRQHPQGAA
ncbi:phosphatase PAP2 family protein [Spirosoma utsteinense]|uniref:Undecaprenyl-diphosphatase n=1 Tax=Spirosoma utsteinense TaxID=2585773 RepID=A0ABR6W592_9BACT|nr:phosphatase PAP2 family protein [Spirosoma utsteinense]MBC3785616.1 undecaprenyl-diphosphatase [Spirosoma utsteinense]MBC3791767.1 undecaprenyl-diphosphatase [Spirosoma utsteinense]